MRSWVGREDSFASINEEAIDSTTPAEVIIGALARRGCVNLTTSIDLNACSQNPYAFGGCCDVYRARLHDGTQIAIKSLRVCDGPEGDSQKRKILKHAARELYHWSKLEHPNVLRLMGLTMFRDRIGMVSEWMDNGTLMSFLRQNPDAERIRPCMDICDGLCYLHENGMIHGDLKAANVMVSAHGVALIADFGNAQLKELTLKFSTTSKFGISLRWTAPELLVDEGNSQPTKEADVYAYGMTVLEVLTGEVPFQMKKEVDVLRLVLQKKRPPRPEVELRDEMWELMSSCWVWSPGERPSMKSVQDRIQALDHDRKHHVKESSPRSTYRSNIPDRADGSPSLGKVIQQFQDLGGFTDVDKAAEYNGQTAEPTTENDSSKPATSQNGQQTKRGIEKIADSENETGGRRRGKPPGMVVDDGKGKGTNKKGWIPYRKEYSLSHPMAEFVGAQRLSRSQIFKKIWKYIKEHNLQKPEDRREILCDEPMKRLFGVDGFNMYRMSKLIGEHVFNYKK